MYPWDTTQVPWDIVKITTMLPSVVLSGKGGNVLGLVLVPPGLLQQSRSFSTPWDWTLNEGKR
jgi:hypothetical protein